MELILYVIIAVLVIGFAVLIFFIIDLKKKTAPQGDSDSMKVMLDWMKEMKHSTEATREGMQKSIDDTNKAINERLDNAGRVIAGLSKELGNMSQIGPDIRRLSEVLASPKARGNFGEEMLENMLSQVLPKSSYQAQYKFKNGEVVDIIVRVGDKILPIDSKFSLENYRLFREAKEDAAAESLRKTFLKDIKKRIDEIHKKYILPQENTFDFALMYIQSEGVFSEALEDITTLAYAREKKVYFVSPNTLYHHLQIVLLSLRGQKINQAAEHILSMISGIKQESDKFGRNLEVLTNHIKNSYNTIGTVTNDFAKLKASISNASTVQLEGEVEVVDKVVAKKLLE